MIFCDLFSRVFPGWAPATWYLLRVLSAPVSDSVVMGQTDHFGFGFMTQLKTALK